LFILGQTVIFRAIFSRPAHGKMPSRRPVAAWPTVMGAADHSGHYERRTKTTITKLN